MTHTFRTYEFTAFAVSELGIGHRVDKGETFTMPGAASLCFEVKDNDSFLSGEGWCNDRSADGYGQTASIMDQDGAELGNGRQIYAESYHWVKDQHGNHYVMIEIEQEGSGADYVTFYTGGGYSVPPAGAVLTVGSECNVSGNWIDFKCLDAGEKVVDDPWDFNEDTCTYTIEAEAWDLHGFKAVHGDKASGGELVKISGHDGKLSTDFGGTDGVYNMTICAQDECDGNSKLMVYVNGEFQQTIILNQNTDGAGSDDSGFSEVTLQGLEIAEGDKVEIRAWQNGGEFVRIDAIKFEQVKFAVCDDPDAVKVGFDGFAAGDILGTQIDGVTISAMGGSGDAMIFDSQNPTGGDDDLETQVAQLGNVLIVSEDGDSSDPDDAIGGKLTFDFDNPSSVFDIKVIDTEEGGTITLTLSDGSTQTFVIPNLVNGGVGQVVMDVDDVVRMDVQLNGSGAVDDLCFVPGAEPLGSLSGRYFCDDNRDGLDNDGTANGVAGVTVALLDENGDPVLDAAGAPRTATTDGNGNYAFAGLLAGTYAVMFADTVSGKVLTTKNVDGDVSNDIDSDASDLGGGMSVINNIVVVAGADTPDNDAGVVQPNMDPTANDDAGKICADEELTVDVLANDSDDQPLAITQVGGQAITEGGTVDVGGILVSLVGGQLVFDGEDAFESLDIGEEAEVTISYTVSDGLGGEASANVDLTFCGVANSVQSIDEFLKATGGAQVTFELEDIASLGDFINAYTIDLQSSTFGNIPLGDYAAAYCIDSQQDISFGVVTTANVLVATEANAASVSGIINADKIDSVNWLLNNDFTLVDNGDGTGDTYTDLEVQEAIWLMLNDDVFFLNGQFTNPEFTDNQNGVRDGVELATIENAMEIANAAMSLGDGFEAGAGQVVGLILDPIDPESQDQPLIIGVNFNDLDCIC